MNALKCFFSILHSAEGKCRPSVDSDEQAWDNVRRSSQQGKTKPTGPSQLRLEWLTAAVSVWGLGWSVLQTVQDLPFANITVSNQEELEQIVITFHRAALTAHPGSQQGAAGGCRWMTMNFSRQQRDGDQTDTPGVIVLTDSKQSNVCHPMNLVNRGQHTSTDVQK